MPISMQKGGIKHTFKQGKHFVPQALRCKKSKVRFGYFTKESIHLLDNV